MKLNAFKLTAISISIVYIWFGVLKVLGVSPVSELVKSTYPTFPEPNFLIFLGIWEIVIGFLLLWKKTLKVGVFLMWIQLSGIFFGVILNPQLYFSSNNILFLSSNGEFVVKNFVLLAASYYLFSQSSKAGE